MGIPTVGIVTDPFIKDAETSAEGEGMHLRDVVMTHPVTQTGPAAKEKAKAAMDKIIKGLTAPLTEEEKKTGFLERPKPPRIAVRGTLEEIQEYFRANNWTDGLPIIPPTEEAVRKMLTGTSHSPDKVIGLMPPENWKVTVEGVAINAVMAGCKPKHMPVLLAMIEAFMKQKLFFSTVRSTTSFSFPVVVNGPIAKEIGMNSGLGALGGLGADPSPNAAIGRALRLSIVNLGGSVIGINDMGAIGNPARDTFSFAENEKESPWKPLHVDMGYKPEESVVTVFTGGWFAAGPGTLATLDPKVHVKTLVKELKAFGGPYGAMIVLTPLLAQQFAKEGFTKKDLQELLWKEASVTFGEWWKLEWISGLMEPRIGQPGWWPAWYRDRTISPEKIVPLFPSPETIRIVVVGVGSNPFHQTWHLHKDFATVSVDKWR